MTSVDRDDYPPHLQWATDPTGRRYWITAAPSFGFNPLAALLQGLIGSRSPAKSEVHGVVKVVRVEGDQQTEVFFDMDFATFDDACARAKALADEIEQGTFQERSPDS
ncbi:MAG: hypothetical protein QM747_12890 [Nocardioides sp.]